MITHCCRPSKAALQRFKASCTFYRQYSDKSSYSIFELLQQRIKISGAVPVAEYMKTVLTHPAGGYYMHRDVIGSQGDFITSPEISQVFGELIAVWCIHEWSLSGGPRKVQVVELGPGKGSLADDMLRVFKQFKDFKSAVSLHLVEVSPHMRKMQENILTESHDNTEESSESRDIDNTSKKFTKTKHDGIPVTWYTSLEEVPRGYTFYIAHEFFDALPVHKFKKENGEWREILVALNDAEDSLRFVRARDETPVQKVFLKPKPDDPREHIEICPDALSIVKTISDRVNTDGGAALIADYGHSGEKGDTFRAFRAHKLYDPLVEPGSADLTADVDFSAFKNVIGDEACVHGPVTQSHWLHTMGIGPRLQILMNKNPSMRKSLIMGYDMLTNPQKMGERFKFFSILPKNRTDIPAGFEEQTKTGKNT